MKCGWIALAIIVLGWTSAGRSSPYDDLDTLIPQVEMSEAVFKTLSAALDSFQPGRGFTPDLRNQNAAALARMRRLPWPDLKRLEFKRFSLTEQDGKGRTAWHMPSRKWSDYLILPASFEALSLRESEVSKVVAANYLDGVAALLASQGETSGLGRMVLGIDDEGTWATTELLLFHHAYAAAYFGKQEEARKLLHRALREKSTCIADAY
jgi:hypothetical protein